jgi:hypothetical protein
VSHYDTTLDSFYKATVDKKREPLDKYYKVESQAEFSTKVADSLFKKWLSWYYYEVNRRQ